LLTELIALLGAGLLVGTAQSWLRLRRGVCRRCGSRHRSYPGGPPVHTVPSAAPAGLRHTAYLMLLGLLPWATVKLVWGLGGDALGMTAKEWRRSTETSQSSELTKFFESFGIDLTVLAGLVGGVLVLALVQRWAWRIPRWLLLLPAWIGGISLPVYGFSLLGAWLPDAGRRLPKTPSERSRSRCAITVILISHDGHRPKVL
jgi:uncharacterized membrane protein YeaQ/YmgE (transglycosylase-associated protein family)